MPLCGGVQLTVTVTSLVPTTVMVSLPSTFTKATEGFDKFVDVTVQRSSVGTIDAR